MARLATSAAHFYQRLQEIYPQKLLILNKQSEQSSPFRRWTTGSGAGSSYRHHDHRNMYNKQISEGAANGGGAAGGVARWSLGLEQLLADPAGASAFAHFLAKEFAAENINFWWSCEQYSKTEDPAKRAALATEIWQRHLDEKAPEPVNVDAAARRAAALRLCSEPSPQDLFQQAQKQIFNVMKFDSYPRFLRSGVHSECARADLCGLPPPYAPASEENTPTKLKKSASNVSERRRSGGASLLPWKLRAPSRDRAPAPAPHPHPHPHPQLTDVVKSSQSAGQCSLCRVVLPDGATSVVGVEESVTVAELVRRLLQRRNLRCDTYDVLLRGSEGQTTTIDLASPSSALGGREVTVSRRVVLRVEVCGRAVSVRCGGGRRLRHVLRPVLQRYLPHLPAHSARLRPAPPHPHPDTPATELEGARLRIIEVCENGERGVICVLVRDPAHAQQDDADAQSISVASTSSRSRDYNGLTDTLGIPTNGLDDGLDDGLSCDGSLGSLSSNGLNGTTSGRVRAALRSGAPLHHHPPDFLENLRETQRQRLQTSKDDAPLTCASAPAPSPAPASPRAPPPLPPKPPQRPPTVV